MAADIVLNPSFAKDPPGSPVPEGLGDTYHVFGAAATGTVTCETISIDVMTVFSLISQRFFTVFLYNHMFKWFYIDYVNPFMRAVESCSGKLTKNIIQSLCSCHIRPEPRSNHSFE